MAVDFATFLSVAPHILNSRLPVLVRGRHGVGKSEVVYQIAAARDLPVVERRASQMTEGDLLGLPDTADTAINGRKATTWNAPDWLVTACEQPVCLFLDEVDRATMEVRQGLFELTDSRKLNGWKLHPGTLIVAAVNGGEHGAQYQVGEMDPAELDRWTVFDVEPTVEDWLVWAEGNVDRVVWDFINQNRDHLEHTGDIEPSKVYPSRRSWARLNAVLSSANMFQPEGFDAGILFTLTNGFVGTEAAIALVDFVKGYDRQVSIEDVLDAGSFEKLEDYGITEYTALVDKMEAAKVFTEDLTDTRAKNLAHLFATMPSEVAMKLWTALTGNAESEDNVVKFYAQSPLGTPVADHLIEMLGQDNQ